MENQQPAWQRNSLLITGIALPFLFMLFVVSYQMYLKTAAPLPRYAPVYAMLDENYYYGSGCCLNRYAFTIKDDHLTLTLTLPEAQKDREGRDLPFDPIKFSGKIYILRDPEGAPEEYKFQPTSLDAAISYSAHTITLPEALNVKIIDGNVAPDGYTYLAESYGADSPGFPFASSRNAVPKRIEKNGRFFPLIAPNKRGSYYGNDNFIFIGWIAEPVRP